MSSAAIAIRDAVRSRIENLRRFVKISTIGVPQLQADDLPYCAIFISREAMAPDGDSNVGEPRFVSDVTIAISVVRAFTESSTLDADTDQDFADIANALLTDPTFVRFGRDPLFESIERIDTRRLYPQVAETYVCELRMEMTFRTRIGFEPVVFDDYHDTVLTVRPVANPDAPAITVLIVQSDA